MATRGPRRDLAAASRQGAVEFRLSRSASGISVERRQLRVGAGTASHSMRFADEAAFLRWCEADSLKYSYPLLYSTLKRHGCALLSAGMPAGPAA